MRLIELFHTSNFKIREYSTALHIFLHNYDIQKFKYNIFFFLTEIIHTELE